MTRKASDADQPVAYPAEHDHRSRRNHRQIHRRCGHGIWNAPLNVPHHEFKACAAALDMIDRIAVLNRERQDEANAAASRFCHFDRYRHQHWPMPCRQPRVQPSLQLFGSWRSGKRCFTSGGQTKAYGVPIIIGSKTGEKAKEKLAILELDLVKVIGRTEPDTIYALLGREDVASDIRFQELRSCGRP